jgi:hypothetical protein
MKAIGELTDILPGKLDSNVKLNAASGRRAEVMPGIPDEATRHPQHE